jgi:hypothetical protein
MDEKNKTNFSVYCLKETYFKYKGADTLNIKGWRKKTH